MNKEYKIDLSDRRFGRLLVIGYVGNRKWLCQCDCGKISTVRGDCLQTKSTQSCGCLQKERSTKHGRYGSPEYRVWKGMLSRCYNRKTPQYRNYGGRGISVFRSWRNSFQAFYDYIGPRPSLLYSIDRINTDGNYEPGNVRWATKREQSLNQRKRSIYAGKKSSSEFIGVTLYNKRFAAQFDHKLLGHFETGHDAAVARDAAVIKSGLLAKLNFPKS